MSDLFFEDELQHINLWDESQTITASVIRSAFLPYDSNRLKEQFAIKGPAKRASSMRKRITEFQRTEWRKKVESMEAERERGFKHMMNERMRRKRHRDYYSALHSILPKGTKGDKKSIIETATIEMEELKKSKEAMERRNSEVEAELASLREEKAEEEGGATIKLAMDNTSSKLDSVLEILKYIKSMGLAARSILCDVSDQEFSVDLQIDSTSKGKAAEVEKAVQRRLYSS